MTFQLVLPTKVLHGPLGGQRSWEKRSQDNGREYSGDCGGRKGQSSTCSSALAVLFGNENFIPFKSRLIFLTFYFNEPVWTLNSENMSEEHMRGDGCFSGSPSKQGSRQWGAPSTSGPVAELMPAQL